MNAPRALNTLDPRPVALLCLVFGILTWQTDALGAACHLALFLGLILCAPRLGGSRGGQNPAGPPLLRAGLVFVGMWTAVKFVMLLWEAGWKYQPAHLTDAGLLGLRLCALLAIGVALTALTSPLALCRAAAWTLRPLLKRRAWEPALALALMLHFVPLIWGTAGRIRLAMRCRQLPLSRRRQTLLFLQTLLRALATGAWTQTLAIAARDLDRDDAWRWRSHTAGHAVPPRAVWLACLTLMAAGLWLALR
ncbi:CbiQ family ECF transporter T component [Megalodesulfovibrio gigas]|uniref:Putative ABC-type transporter, integral membrane subunit n=1 Tax=Megalodesulfovibrio gigas (strain ATCC 19364 / DSM 1382 / NCIMB 9332 / VKM B-1759) TaxID=1121448 RepID=T2G9R0_MEGG1|nr:CbiQ family ECF transporter T component [Megalodesulfovibrio gigas]AGW13330.1 putative ABC-type transporter, integral membrane subunit [Megalodesulfovibrio gigas DSM 1382 = ATCC 19364]